MSLKQDLQKFDGKHLEILERIAEHYLPNAAHLDELLAFAAHPLPRVQQAATLLLKRRLETGTRLSEEQVNKLMKLLARLNHWEALLHTCQMIPHLATPRRYKKKMASFLLECLKGENKFVRAWAYNGLYELAKLFRDTDAVVPLLMKGMNDEAPSVRARVRKIFKEIDSQSRKARLKERSDKTRGGAKRILTFARS